MEPIQILNIYGPYRDRDTFWRQVDQLGLFLLENLIVGGDLNITLGLSEVFGGTHLIDLLTDYIRQLFIRANLVDISLTILGPTWSNGCYGDEFIAKQLDRFLVSGDLADRIGRYRSWPSPEVSSDHFPVSLQVDFQFHKAHYPFKFNKIWLRDKDFLLDVESFWYTLRPAESGTIMDSFLHKLSMISLLLNGLTRRKRNIHWN